MRFSLGFIRGKFFPIVAATNVGTNGSTTNHTVNLPTGIVAGDRLLFFICGAQTAASFNTPAGWTQLFHQLDGGGETPLACYHRLADGTEGATVAITSTAPIVSAHTSYRITGSGGAPECGIAAQGISQFPDPPNLTPSWGTDKTLWLAANCAHRQTTAYPTNYTNGILSSTGAGSAVHASLGTCRRQLEAASDNPGTFTIESSRQWIANIVGLRP